MIYYCRKIEEDLFLDGNADKQQWKTAKEIRLVDNSTGGKPQQAATAKLLWNDRNLYVCFKCTDNYINATMTGYNDRLYEEEVAEVFIDDNRDMKTYIELEVNPLNALLHYSIHNDLKGNIIGYGRVDKNIKSAVLCDKLKGIWSAELEIPFSEFITAENIPPEKGDRWLANFYRIDRPKDKKAEYTAWSPTGQDNFHRPEKFGELIFD
ncbi:carbohydrate-binding family 9-like protein [Ruminiclostridium sufflavum]|nr:carbohydrate-binding family 9-like protein [Ruminiclostridium sufflavum]